MRRLVRAALLAGASAAVIGGGITAAPSSAAAGGAECNLAGTANFTPGIGSDPTATWTYDFGGTLTGCQSSDAAAPASGTVSAGRTITVNGVVEQEPAATGTGSCAAGQTSGIAFISWADGSTTIIEYTTDSATAAVALEGSTLPSYTFPDGTTLSSTRYLDGGSVGVLEFSVADPTQCTVPDGVKSATISGVTGVGSPS